MLIKNIAIIGGTGFVGRRLANRLATEGYQLRLPTRDRERHKDNLILLPGLELLTADVHDPRQLGLLFDGCDAVINLAGILNERNGTTGSFQQVHVDLTKKIIIACRERGVKRLLHMSALNAATSGASAYLRSKGEAEALVHAATDIQATSFRPSVIFGPGDSFFNRFAALLKFSPMLPLACPNSRFTPVFVGDVAEAMALALTRPDCYGRRLHLGGPDQYTLEQLVRYTADCLHIKRLIVPLPDLMARVQAEVFDLWGFMFNLTGVEKPFSTDNYLSLQTDSVCTTEDLSALGITATGINSVVPHYLGYTNYRSRYDGFRQQAHRRR